MPAPDLSGQPLTGISSYYYRSADEVRFRVALRTARYYQEKGLPWVLIGTSPDPRVAEGFRELGALLLETPEKLSRPGAYKEALRFAFAHGATQWVTHEPEKDRIPLLFPKILAGLKEADCLVIGRSEQAFATLPETMQWTERFAGESLRRDFGFPADSFSGARAGTRDIAERYVLPFDESRGDTWHWQYCLILDALNDKAKVGGVLIDLEYPAEMTAEENADPAFTDKRYAQLAEMLRMLLSERERQ